MESEPQRSYPTGPKLHNQWMAEMDLEPSFPNSQFSVLSFHYVFMQKAKDASGLKFWSLWAQGNWTY